MEKTNPPKMHPSTKEDEEEWRNQYQNLLQTLPTERSWNGGMLRFYQGIWYTESLIKGLVFFQKYYKPFKTDIILASYPKSGTTWLKALAFTIVNRSHYSLKDTPLLTTNSHQLVPFFEFGLCMNDHFPDLDIFPQPRIFATHASYDSLPCSIKDSENKIVYICRNPLDQLISLWNFIDKLPSRAAELGALDEAFESYCRGVHGHGPFWDHILGYWRATTERPDKVLFLKYEDLKKDNVMCIKKLANFLGFPFTEEEEKEGLIQDISNFCGFESMKNLEVNKTGTSVADIANSNFFRKGEVGDFRNHLSPDMIEKMEKLIQEKFGHFGLSFNLS